jgi:hypothetical protein
MIDSLTIAAELESTSYTQQDVFNFIVRFYEVNRCGPTIGEIGKALGVIQERNPFDKRTVHYHLKELAKKGKIELPRDNQYRIGARIIVPHSSWKYHGYRDIKFKKEILP